MNARHRAFGLAVVVATVVAAAALLCVALGVLVVDQAHAQASEPSVRVDVLRDDDTIGAPITLRLTVDLPAGAELVVPVAPTPLGALEPAVPEIIDRAATPQGERFTIVYRTRAFFTGALPVEFPPWSWLDATGALHDFSIAPLQLDVASVLPNDGEAVSPRPLKPAETIDGAAPALGAILGPIAGGLALIVLAATIVRRRRRHVPVVALPPPDPATEATAALARIREAGLLPERIPEFCHRLDLAVREFLAARYGIPAPSLTAGELPGRLAAAGAQVGAVQMVANLVAQTDAVAYAGVRPPAERVARYLDLAGAIVDVRPPAPPAVPPPTSDAAPPGRQPPPPATRPPTNGNRWARPSDEGAP